MTDKHTSESLAEFQSDLTLKSSYRSSSRSLVKFGSENLGRTKSRISCEKATLACGSHAQ